MRRHCGTLAGLLLIGALGALLAQPQTAHDRALTSYRLGLDQMRAEAFERAEQAFQAAVDIDPEFEMAHYMLGRARMPQRKFVAAIAAFTTARDLYRSAAGRRFSSAQEAQRYRQDRIAEIDELIRQVQNGPQSFQTQQQIRQLNERRRLLQESIRRGHDVSIGSSVPAYVSLALGSAYFRAGRLEDAEREYKATLAADPRAGEAHNNLAVVYLETGRYAEAKAALSAAKKTGFRVHPDLEVEIERRSKGTFS